MMLAQVLDRLLYLIHSYRITMTIPDRNIPKPSNDTARSIPADTRCVCAAKVNDDTTSHSAPSGAGEGLQQRCA